jgi:hypothetical protein
MITDVAITGLTKAMDSLKGSIESAFGFAQRAEKSSLALGMSFGQASDQLGGQMRGLRGDLNERFAGAIAGLEAGLQGNTAGIGRLINQQRLTGTSSAKTAAAFANMEMTMGLSREATNKLASDMVEMGAEFQISTDNLVGAINMMAESFPAQKLAGMGAEVNAAVAGLQAELGPAMSGPLNNVMKMVMDTSMEGYEKLTQLGIGGVREQLAAAKSQEEAQMILKNAIATASDNFKSVVGDASQGFFQVGVAADIFGKSAIDLTTIQDAFGQRVAVEQEQTADFGNQLSVMKDEILLPLQEAFLEFFPIIKNVASIIATNLREAVQGLVIQGMRLYLRFGGLQGIVEKAKEKFAELKEYFAKTLIPNIMKFKDVALVGLGIAIGLLTIKFTIMAITAVLPLITAFGGLLLAVFPVAAPFIAIAAIVGGLVLLFTDFDGVVSFLKNTFLDFADFVGRMITKLGSVVPLLGDTIEAIGDSIQGAAESLRDKPKEVFADGTTGAAKTDAAAKNAEAAKAAAEQKKTDEEILKAFSDQMELDQKAFGFNEQTAKNTDEINKKTPEIETTPQFLDETANMLGRSIEGILGIGADTTSQEMLEELRVANEQRAAQQNQPNEGATNTGS